MTIPSQQEYEANEARQFRADLTRIERAPLADRKEGAQAFFAAMRDQPEVVGERAGWLIAGNYGYGAMQAAKRMLASRGNKVAWLCQTVGALDWQSPQAMSIARWKLLTASQKAKLAAAINKAIKSHREG